MRILFMGTPEFAIPSLQILLDHNYPIVSVATAADKPKGRGREMALSPVKQFAVSRKLPILQPENLKDPQFVRAVRALEADLIVVVAFRILPKEIYSLPRLGAFNLHASLLPKYRGAAPINWAIIKGESETGVTTFFLQEKVDTGSVILQARVRIGAEETAGELHDKLAEVGAEIVFQTVRLIELGKAVTHSQDDQQATPAPKIFREHCRIDWNNPTSSVHNFIRGLSPSPCAWTTHGGKVLKIYKAQVIQSAARGTDSPGTIEEVGPKSLHVATGDSTISILEIQQEGKRRMGAEEFLRGYPLHPGDKFA